MNSTTTRIVPLRPRVLIRPREASDDANAVSYQLAQIDFSERHLVRWVPGLANSVANTLSGSIYHRVIDSIEKFLAADYAWQSGTIITEDKATEVGADD